LGRGHGSLSLWERVRERARVREGKTFLLTLARLKPLSPALSQGERELIDPSPRPGERELINASLSQGEREAINDER
jgi:hypothetical protein